MTTTHNDDIENRIEVGSGNVFKDLGLPNPEERQRKSQLAYQLYKIVKSEGMTQKEAAKLLGITQPQISDIFRGRLAPFSVEKLIRLLELIGCEVNINVVDLKEHRGNATENAPKKRRPQAKRKTPPGSQERIAL